MGTEGPGQSTLLMLDVAAKLDAAGIDYAVVGAMAAAVHGVVRASLDVDAVVSVQLRDIAVLKQLLAAPELEVETRLGDADDPIGALLAVTDAHGNRVNLLIGLRGLDPGAFSRAQNVNMNGQRLRVIGREDFIAMKAFAGSALDLSDARQAIAVDRNSLDLELLQRLANRFGNDAASRVETLIVGSD